MPLNSNTLRDGLRKDVDPAFSGYVGFPADAAGVGTAWASAVRGYFEGVTNPPGITSVQQASAEAAFAAIFQPTFSGADALALLNSALTAYAAVLVPPTGATVAPPGSPTITLSLTSDGNVAATTIATAIDTWARTGTYTPPGGAPTPWA